MGLLGLGIATYLTVERAQGDPPACIAGGGCGIVQASRYSELAGVPVAWLGIAGYLGIIATALVPGPRGAGLGMFVTAVSVGFSGWLTYLELVVIDAICAWCVASAILTVLAFGIALARFTRVAAAVP